MTSSDRSDSVPQDKPGWQLNLEDALLLDSLVLLYGNVKDVFLLPPALCKGLPDHVGSQGYVTLDVWLALHFEQQGFPIVLLYDNVDHAVTLRPKMAGRFLELASPQSTPVESTRLSTDGGATLEKSSDTSKIRNSEWMVSTGSPEEPVDFLKTLYHSVLPTTQDPVAVICRFSDRYLSYTDQQIPDERQLSLLIQKAAMAIPNPASDDLQSRIVMMFDLEGQIPQELESLAPFATAVRIPPPTLEERETFFRGNCGDFHSEPLDRFDPVNDKDHLRTLANLSDGLRMQDLLSLRALSKKACKGLGKDQAKELFNRFRFGDRRNPWQAVKRDRLTSAIEILREEVKGQDEVIEEIVPILKSAHLSMGNLGSSATAGPRGVLFFVGPTGVGKTELTKGLVRLIFERDEALLRFDMSEFQHEHQQARLIGAPPGYIGFDQGGQLTNAILEEPFRVILFDEIEKAYERIWDNFLQILDDGRLTDGRGRTVYFSDALIVFTSNLGTTLERMSPQCKQRLIARIVEDPVLRSAAQAQKLFSVTDEPTDDEISGLINHILSHPQCDDLVSPSLVNQALSSLPYSDLSSHFRDCVSHFFRNRIGRPEILGRLGEGNIHVFRFITDEATQREVIAKELNNLRRHLHKRRIGLTVTECFVNLLRVHQEGFIRNGVRGVKNLLKKFVEGRIVSLLFDDPKQELRDMVFICDYQDRQSGITEMEDFTPEAISRTFNAQHLTVEPAGRDCDRYEWEKKIDENGAFTNEKL